MITIGNVLYVRNASGEFVPVMGGGGGTSESRMSIAHYVGQLFEKPEGRAYVGWALGNVAYDPNDDTVNVLVNVADTHDMTDDENRPDLYLCKMNPQTLEHTLTPIVYDEAVVNQTNADEVTWVAGTKGAYTYGLCIDSNGDYLFMPNYCGKAYLFRSSDHGASWKVTVCNMSNVNDYAFTGLMQTSTGRLIVSTHSSYFWYSDDNGANWTKCATPTDHSYGHEACIVELEKNELIAVMRKRWSATSNNSWNGTPEIDPAFICYSHDNGTTWTNGVESKTITEMSASGAAIAMLGDGMVELYATSRYPHGDANAVIYRHRASIEDALADRWSSGKVVRYAKAVNRDDFGYPGCCVDGVGNTHLVYYDGDAETSGSTNYYYIQSYSEINNVPINADSLAEVNPSIPYSASKVMALIAAASAKLQAQIDKLIIQGGGTPEGGDKLDGSAPVYTGLYEWVDFLDASQYDASTYTFSGNCGKFDMVAKGADFVSALGVKQDVYEKADLSSDLTVANGVTIECEHYMGEASTVNTTANIIGIGVNNNVGGLFAIINNGKVSVQYYKEDGTKATTSGGVASNIAMYGSVGTYTHATLVCTNERIDGYVDGELFSSVIFADISDFDHLAAEGVDKFAINGAWGTTGNYSRFCRVYNRALTAEEVKNNYKYSKSQREA